MRMQSHMDMLGVQHKHRGRRKLQSVQNNVTETHIPTYRVFALYPELFVRAKLFL